MKSRRKPVSQVSCSMPTRAVCHLIACSHRRHGQQKTVLSCLVRVGGVNRTGDNLDPVSNLQLFSLKRIEDYWKLGNWKLGRDKTKLSCFVAICVHTVDTDKTRQSCLMSVSVVWTSYNRSKISWVYAYIPISHRVIFIKHRHAFVDLFACVLCRRCRDFCWWWH